MKITKINIADSSVTREDGLPIEPPGYMYPDELGVLYLWDTPNPESVVIVNPPADAFVQQDA